MQERTQLVLYVCLFVAEAICRQTIGAAATDREELFGDHLAILQLEVRTNFLADLARHPSERVPGTLRWNNSRTGEVTLHLVSAIRDKEGLSKPPFGIRLPTALALDADEIHLDPMQEGNYLEEYCAARIAHALDVPMSRVGHAKVILNGRDLGLYVMTEGPTSEWAQRRFGCKPGRLLEGQGVDILGPLEIKYQMTGGVPAEEADHLEQVAQAVGLKDLSVRSSALHTVLDWDRFCRLMALESLTCFSRGYTLAASNYRVFVDAKDGKATFIPCYMQSLFRGTFQPILLANSLVARAVAETDDGRLAYLQGIALVVTNAAIEAELLQALRERTALLQSHVSGGTAARRLVWHSGILERSLRERFASVRVKLQEIGPLTQTSLAAAPVSTMGLRGLHQPGSLPVRSDGKHKKLFLELAQGAEGLHSSCPLKQYTISITAPAGALEGLTWKSTNWLPVSVAVPGAGTFTNVGLHLKGQATRKDFMAKSSFTLKFNWRNKGRSLDGSTKLHFHNGLFNPSFLNEFTLSWLFRRAGLPAPEVGFAEVLVNGRPHGVFVTVEGITKSFLRKNFDSADGLLFEGDQGDIDAPLDLDNGTLPQGYSDLKALLAAASLGMRTNSWDPIEPCLPLHHLTTFTALEMVSGHWDGYALSTHNYRIYQPSLHGPFYLIPHGFDALAPYLEDGVCPRMKGVLAQAILSVPSARVAYLNCVNAVLTTVLDLDLYTADAAVATRWLQEALQRSEPFLASSQLSSAATLVDSLARRKTFLWDRLRIELRQPVAAQVLPQPSPAR